MPTSVKIVRSEDVPWEEHVSGDHYASVARPLSANMTLGVNVERIAPGKVSAPYHYHLVDDEFFLVLSGRAMLRTADGTVEVGPGDAISCPKGEDSAHQFFNHTDQPTEILMVGRNDPDEICGYPDSGKFMVRRLKKVGRLIPAPYMDGEPDPPRIKG